MSHYDRATYARVPLGWARQWSESVTMDQSTVATQTLWIQTWVKEYLFSFC